MQNPFRIKNDQSLKQILSDQNFEYTDLYRNFISPWNNIQRKSQQFQSISYNPYSTLKDKLTFAPVSQKIKITRLKKQRTKTEESKYSKTCTQFRKCSNKFDENFSNLFPTDYFTKRNSTTPLKLNKNRQLQSRQKFKTPVVNINQFSFTKDKKILMNTLIPKLQEKFDPNLNNCKPVIFSKQSSNLSLAKYKKKQLGKLQTQKTIPMKRMSDIQRSKKLRKQLQNLYDGHGALVENLKRIVQPQKQKGFRQLKCRSVNKLNKTIF